MGKRTRYEPGTFSWVELATTDAASAKAFYGRLFGWEAADTPVPGGGTYTMLKLDGDDVAALYEPGDGRPPQWLCYVTVDDADGAAGRASELGADVIAAPFDVMTAGRMTVLADPTGAALALWQPREHIGAGRVNDAGCLTWCDLATPDPDAAERFYTGLFGWELEAVDSGGGPPYWIVRNAGRHQAGMRPAQSGEPAHWLPYFTVQSLDAAVAQGGEPLFGPVDVPNGGRIAALPDPQGAVFALFEGDVED